MSSFHTGWKRLQSLSGLFGKRKKSKRSHSPKSHQERSGRHLVFDPLEERRLLTIGPVNVLDTLVNQQVVASQTTLAGQSVATDHSGDFVVTWTRNDTVYAQDYAHSAANTSLAAPIATTGPTTISVLSGVNAPTAPFYISVDSENMLVSAVGGIGKTQWTVTARGLGGTTAATHNVFASVIIVTPTADTNIYARYFTNEVQRLTLPAGVLTDTDPTKYATFAMAYGGNEIQQISITPTYPPNFLGQTDIAGTFQLTYTDSVGVTHTTAAITFSETNYTSLNPTLNPANLIQTRLQALAAANPLSCGDLADVQVKAIDPHTYQVLFGAASGGRSQSMNGASRLAVTAPVFTTGYLPAIEISVVRQPTPVKFPLSNIPISPTDASKTASAIQQAFLQTSTTFPIGPVTVPAPLIVPLTLTTAVPSVLVQPHPITDPSDPEYDPQGLRHFDITFTGDSGKSQTPALAISAINDELGVSLLSSATPVKIIKMTGDEFRVNPPEPQDPFSPGPSVTAQTAPAVAMDDDGSFVIAWQSAVPDSVNFGSVTDIFARRFAPVGEVSNPAAIPGMVASPTGTYTTEVRALVAPGNQSQLLTINLNGTQPASPQFKLQIGGATTASIPFTFGDPVATAGAIRTALIAAGFDGVTVDVNNAVNPYRFKVTFTGTSGQTLQPVMVYVADPTSPLNVATPPQVANLTTDAYTFRANTNATNAQRDPAVGMDGQGNFVIAWDGEGQSISYFNGIGAQRFDHNGNRLGGEFLVNAEDTQVHNNPYVAVSHDGHFLVTWDLVDPIAGTSFVQAKFYDAAGAILPNPAGALAQWVVNAGVSPTASFDMNNDFLIGWDQLRDKDNTNGGSPLSLGVFAREYAPTIDATTKLITGETIVRQTFRVSSASFNPDSATTWPNAQSGNQVVMDADGDVTGVYAGFGPDVSENAMIAASYYSKQYNDPANADLLPFLPGTLSALSTALPADAGYSFTDNFPSSDGDVQAEIEAVLISAENPLPKIWPRQKLTFTAATGTYTLSVNGSFITATYTSGNLAASVTSLQTALDNSFGANVVTVMAGAANTIIVNLPSSGPSTPITKIAGGTYAGTITILPLPATTVELGRIRAILDSVATVLRGSASGAMYSQFDAGPDPYTLHILESDSIINTTRDGNNARYVIDMNRDAASGSFTVKLSNDASGSALVTVPVTVVSFTDGNGNVTGLDTANTAAAIQAALASSGVVGVNWPTPPYEGPVEVRIIPKLEILQRAGLGGAATGTVQATNYKLTTTNIWEVQTLTFTAGTGTYTVSINGFNVTATFNSADIAASVTSLQTAINNSFGLFGVTVKAGLSNAFLGTFTLNVAFPVSTSLTTIIKKVAGGTYAGTITPLIDTTLTTTDTAFEVIFQGESHDSLMTLFVNSSALKDVPVKTVEVQSISFGAAAGWYTLTFNGKTSTNVYYYDPANAANDVNTKNNILGFLQDPNYGNLPNLTAADVTGTNGVYTITFSQYPGVDQPPLATGAPPASTATPPPNTPALPSVTSSEVVKGGTTTADSVAPFTFTETIGDPGSVRHDVSIGMTPGGSFVTVWTQDDRFSSAGTAGQSIYFRQFQESTDTAGPIVTGLVVNGTAVDSGTVINGAIKHLVVTFDEAMLTFDAPTIAAARSTYNALVAAGQTVPASIARILNSVTNPDNYQLFKSGALLPSGAIVSVDYGLNKASELATTVPGDFGDLNTIPTNKFEAVLTFSTPLTIAAYALKALTPQDISAAYPSGRSGLTNAAGTPLNKTGFVPAGADQTLSFTNLSTSTQPLSPDTPDVPINPAAAGNQTDPSVAATSNGNYVVTWTSTALANADIVGQRFYSTGKPNGNAFTVNTTLAGNQIGSSVAMDSGGDFVVVWSGAGPSTNLLSNTSDVFGQLYGPGGNPVGTQFQINQYLPGTQSQPRVAMANDGTFVVTWTSYGQSGNQNATIYAREYTQAGAPMTNEFRVTDVSSSARTLPDVAMDKAHDFIVTWAGDIQSSSTWGAFGRYYSANGLNSTEIRLNNLTDYRGSFSSTGVLDVKPTGPRVSMADNGNFVVTWAAVANSPTAATGYDIYARRFSAGGVARDASEVLVNQTTLGWQLMPDVGVNGNGDYTVAWTSFGQDNAELNNPALRDYGIYARMYNSDGTDFFDTALGKKPLEFRINGTTVGNQIAPAVDRKALSSDSILVWVGPGTPGTSLFSRIVDPPTATVTVPPTTINVAPLVTTNPSSQTVNDGQSVSFTATASGTPAPTVQWQVSANAGASYTNILGATATTYSFTAAAAQSGNRYLAVFTNTAGTRTTNAATLTVNVAPVTLVAPVVSINPSSQTVNDGQSVSFTAAASGLPAPTVQWQVSANGGAYTNILGATATTLTFTATAVQSGNRYLAVFTNAAGTVTTTAATVTVNVAPVVPVVTTNPSSQAVNAGQTVSFTAAATGTPAPTVQWQVSANGGAYTNILGATATTYTFTAAATQSGNYYLAVFTNAAGTATTTAAALTVNTAPVVPPPPVVVVPPPPVVVVPPPAAVVPTISIGNVTITRPTLASVKATFIVTLSAPSTSTVTVNYSTINGTAMAGLDYAMAVGKLTFAPGVTSLPISVTIMANSTKKTTGTFNIALSMASAATIKTSQATCTISSGLTLLQPAAVNLLLAKGLV